MEKVVDLKCVCTAIMYYINQVYILSLNLFRHNDLPWNIRKFVHNQIQDFNFSSDLRKVEPWSRSTWSHTDLLRLQEGMVGCQVVAPFIYL